ncbi:hypothetical protein [Microbacterium sp. E-13]|uniref:hypothetical protein n=1 Tax=Microbacterium sp. E-13 TaxID=3404048 RepID=UPI003CFB658F
MTPTTELITAVETEQQTLAQRLLDTEASIIAGDPKKSLKDIEHLEREARTLDLKLRRLNAQRERELALDQHDAISAIRDEILASQIGDAEHFVQLLDQVDKAVSAFITAADERFNRMHEWKTALTALGIDRHRIEHGLETEPAFDPAGPRIWVDGNQYGTIHPLSYIEAIVREPDASARVRNLSADLRSELGQPARK